MLKKLVLFTAIATCSVSLMSCGNSQSYIAQKATASEVSNTKTAVNNAKSASKEADVKVTENSDKSTSEITQVKSKKVALNQARNVSEDFPEIATVRQLKVENSGCTLTLEDENGQIFSVGTSLSLCQNQAAFLDKKVRAIYEQGSRSVVVTSLEILAQSPVQTDSQTMTNGKWTFTIWSMNAWSGVNNTGDAIYHGCDSQGNCIDLDQGKTSCRDGVCTTGWQNGDYFYVVESTITERPEDSQTSLIVRKGDTEIMRETGFWVVSH